MGFRFNSIAASILFYLLTFPAFATGAGVVESNPVPGHLFPTIFGNPGGPAKDVVMDGVVSIVAYDDFQFPEKSGFALQLHSTADKKSYWLFGIDAVSRKITPHSKIRVSGTRQGNLITPNIAQVGGGIITLQAGERIGPEVNLGNNRMIVVIGTFDDLPFLHSNDEVEDTIFGASNSLGSFIRENSGGKSFLSGDVVGPYLLGNSTNMSCPENVLVNCLTRAADPDVNFSNYTRVLFLAPGISSGSTVGYDGGFLEEQTSDGPLNISWSTVKWDNDSNEDNFSRYEFLALVAHEVGHQFGMLHSNYAICENSYFGNDISTCVNQEYGNFFSIMGAFTLFSPSHYTANYKRQVGWFGPSDFTTITHSGIYSLVPLEMPNGLRQLEIPYFDVAHFPFSSSWIWDDPDYFESGHYSLEYRQPIGYDANPERGPGGIIPGSVWNPPAVRYGVFVTFYSKNKNPDTPWFSGDDHLIDATPFSIAPGSGDMGEQRDAPLLVGDGFHDNNIHTSINVLSMDPSGAQVQVVKDDAHCTRAFPSVSVVSQSPTTGIGAGTSVTYTVELRDNDISCGFGNAFDVTPTVPAGWSVTPASGTVQLLYPQRTATATFTVRSPSNVVVGQYPVSFQVRTQQHFRFKTSATGYYVINPPSSGGSPLMALLAKTKIAQGGLFALSELDELDAQADQVQDMDSPAASFAKQKLAQARQVYVSAPVQARQLASEAQTVLAGVRAAKSDADGKVVVALIAGVLLVAAWFNHTQFKKKQRPHQRSYNKNR